MAGKGDDGTRTAHMCMMMIGIGYLFPISAIWAAFDYWKMLFPKDNIEFEVTGVYQVGSVVTVAILSLAKSVSLGPRIMGGFGGQFICLAAIFAFRWLPIVGSTLLQLLIAVVALVSVATGYLDSALLALCSQYSPSMQQSLQIGIGFGTLVSVLYRDATKLLMSGDVANATSFYFAVALLTVLVCVASYKLLVSLPVSKHISPAEDKNGLDETLLDSAQHQSPVSPFALGMSPQMSMTPTQNRADADSFSVDGKDGLPQPYLLENADASFGIVWKMVWKNQLVTFLNLFLTTLCYPGIITSIPCRQFDFLRGEEWFQTLLLTAFTLADMVGRFLTSYRCGLDYSNIYITVLIRSIVFPAMLYCVMSPSSGDVFSFIVVACFGCLNGFCVSLSLIVINEIPRMSDEQRKTNGRISACAVNGGLCAGSLAAAALASALGLGSS